MKCLQSAGLHELEPEGDLDVRLEFGQRSERDADVPAVPLRVGSKCMAFRDVAGDRHGCPSHLRAEAEPLSVRKMFREIVREQHQVHSRLPGIEVPEVPNPIRHDVALSATVLIRSVCRN